MDEASSAPTRGGRVARESPAARFAVREHAERSIIAYPVAQRAATVGQLRRRRGPDPRAHDEVAHRRVVVVEVLLLQSIVRFLIDRSRPKRLLVVTKRDRTGCDGLLSRRISAWMDTHTLYERPTSDERRSSAASTGFGATTFLPPFLPPPPNPPAAGLDFPLPFDLDLEANPAFAARPAASGTTHTSRIRRHTRGIIAPPNDSRSAILQLFLYCVAPLLPTIVACPSS